MLSDSVRIAVVAGAILLLLSVPAASGDEGTVQVFYYGLGDGCLGERHAASHWGQTPENWPDVVDLVRYGIATSDWSIPFGTELCLEVISFPAWSEGEYDDRFGTVVCGAIVVDRMASWVGPVLGPSMDAWSALFQQLAGPDWQRIGTLTARYWMREYSPSLLLNSNERRR